MPAPCAVRSIKWRRVMSRFRFFISTFLLSVLGGERGRKSATGEDTAAAANALIHATLSCERPGPRRHASCRAHQRQQAVARCGTEELAPALNCFGCKSHNTLVEFLSMQYLLRQEKPLRSEERGVGKEGGS